MSQNSFKRPKDLAQKSEFTRFVHKTMEKQMNPALFEEEMERKRLEENRRARVLEITQDTCI